MICTRPLKKGFAASVWPVAAERALLALQDVSTMIRYGLNPIIFLINNGGYTIEVEIHDGPYNNIQGWDYSGLVQCFDNHQGNVFSTKVRGQTLVLLSVC